MRRWGVKDQPRSIEGHHLALLPGELYPDQMNRLVGGAVLVGVALGLNLCQRLAVGQLLHHLELEQIEVAEGLHGHVHGARQQRPRVRVLRWVAEGAVIRSNTGLAFMP